MTPTERVRLAALRGPAPLLLTVVLASCLSACGGTRSEPPAPSGPPVCQPGVGSYGSALWPPGCWFPYGPESPFNQKVPATPTISRDSRAIVGFLLDHAHDKYPGKITVHADGTSDGEPTYWTTSADQSAPRWTIHCETYACPGVEGTTVTIPPRAVAEDGSDHHLTVVDQSTGQETDLWRVRPEQVPLSDVGGLLTVGSAARLPVSTGSGIEKLGNATASSFGSLAGRVRAEEVTAGKLDHALFIVIACHDGKAVFPARSAPKEGTCKAVPDGTLAPPLGTWLQLPMSADEIGALPAWERPYAESMATYGMYFGDTGTDNYFAIESETGSQYTSRGAPNAWRSWAERNASDHLPGWIWYEPDKDWVGIWSGIDWSRLRVLCRPEDQTCVPG